MVSVVACQVIGGVNEKAGRVIAEGIIGVYVVGRPYLKMERGEAVALVLRLQCVGIVSGGVLGCVCENDRLVGTNGVVGMMVESGVYGEVECGE